MEYQNKMLRITLAKTIFCRKNMIFNHFIPKKNVGDLRVNPVFGAVLPYLAALALGRSGLKILTSAVSLYVLVSVIHLQVMDECHHSINDSPYREIMRSIQSETAANRPRILGLTAAVVKDHTLNKKKKAGSGLTVMEKARVLEEMVTDLERCLMARLCTSFDISLANCGADPEIVTVPFPVRLVKELRILILLCWTVIGPKSSRSEVFD